jgi:ABC-type phosphate transport system substrate-binding protein
VKALVAGAALLAAAGAVSGCGVTLNSNGHFQSAGPGFVSATSLAVERATSLPQRPLGQLTLDGDTTEPLVRAVLAQHQPANVTVTQLGDGSATAFESFCAGDVDLVDSESPISAGEYELCRHNGIEPVQFELGAGALVLATRNGSDVGVDCLTLAQAKLVLESGSQISNWQQLGGFDLPLTVAGPAAGSPAFSQLDSSLLGNASASVRSGYVSAQTPATTLADTAGTVANSGDADSVSSAQASVNALFTSLKQARAALDQAEYQVVKGARDKRPAYQQAQDRAAVVAARKNRGVLHADLGHAERFLAEATAASQDAARHLGVVGLFSFSYFEQHLSELRGVEIDSGGDAPAHDCVYPSVDTVATGDYPLGRQLLLTVSLASMRRSDVNAVLATVIADADSESSTLGLVAASPQTLATEQTWVSGAQQPDVVYYPQTSSTSANG